MFDDPAPDGRPVPVVRPPASIAGVVLAAGGGMRLGSGPKAFLRLGGRPLFRIAADLLNEHAHRVLVGVPGPLLEEARRELDGRAEVYAGGDTRFGTIVTLLEQCEEEILVMHEAARPFAPSRLVGDVLSAAREFGAAVAAFPGVTRLVRVAGNELVDLLPKTEGYCLQTPQAYRRGLLQLAADTAVRDNLVDPTPSEVLLRVGVPVHVVTGEQWNYKITTPEDWSIAQLLASSDAWRA